MSRLRGGDGRGGGRWLERGVRGVRGREIRDGGLGMPRLPRRHVFDDAGRDEQCRMSQLLCWDRRGGGREQPRGVRRVRSRKIFDRGLWVPRLPRGHVFDDDERDERGRMRSLRGRDRRGGGREQPRDVRGVRGGQVFDGGVWVHRLPRGHVECGYERDEQRGLRKLRGEHVLDGDGSNNEQCVSVVSRKLDFCGWLSGSDELFLCKRV